MTKRMMILLAGAMLVGQAAWLGCGKDEPATPAPAPAPAPAAKAKAPEATPNTPKPVAKALPEAPVLEQALAPAAPPSVPDRQRANVGSFNSRGSFTLFGPSPEKTAESDYMGSVERILLGHWASIENLTCNIVLQRKGGKDHPSKFKGEGKYFFALKAGRPHVRMEMGIAIRFERTADDIALTGQRTLKIFDGETLFRMQEMHMGGVARKTFARSSSIQFLGGSELLSQIHRSDEVTLVPSDESDEDDMYVFKTTKKGGQIHVDYYVHKSSGFLRKIVTEKAADDSLMTLTFHDYAYNQPLPDDTFTYTVPEGVVFKDLTKTATSVAP